MSKKLLYTSEEFARGAWKDDVEVVCAADIKMQRRGYDSDWGGWRLEALSLEYPAYPGGGVYPLCIEQFTSSAAMLDMIMQVAGKTWATNDCVAGLVHALDYLLNPQASLCSFGSNKTLTRAQIRKCVKSSGRFA